MFGMSNIFGTIRDPIGDAKWTTQAFVSELGLLNAFPLPTLIEKSTNALPGVPEIPLPEEIKGSPFSQGQPGPFLILLDLVRVGNGVVSDDKAVGYVFSGISTNNLDANVHHGRSRPHPLYRSEDRSEVIKIAEELSELSSLKLLRGSCEISDRTEGRLQFNDYIHREPLTQKVLSPKTKESFFHYDFLLVTQETTASRSDKVATICKSATIPEGARKERFDTLCARLAELQQVAVPEFLKAVEDDQKRADEWDRMRHSLLAEASERLGIAPQQEFGIHIDLIQNNTFGLSQPMSGTALQKLHSDLELSIDDLFARSGITCHSKVESYTLDDYPDGVDRPSWAQASFYLDAPYRFHFDSSQRCRITLDFGKSYDQSVQELQKLTGLDEAQMKALKVEMDRILGRELESLLAESAVS